MQTQNGKNMSIHYAGIAPENLRLLFRALWDRNLAAELRRNGSFAGIEKHVLDHATAKTAVESFDSATTTTTTTTTNVTTLSGTRALSHLPSGRRCIAPKRC